MMLTGMCCDGCGMCSDGFAGQLLSWGFADLLALAVLLLPAVAAAHGQAAMHGYQCRLHSMGGGTKCFGHTSAQQHFTLVTTVSILDMHEIRGTCGMRETWSIAHSTKVQVHELRVSTL